VESLTLTHTHTNIQVDKRHTQKEGTGDSSGQSDTHAPAQEGAEVGGIGGQGGAVAVLQHSRSQMGQP